jgi:hypothetical protein
MSEHYPGDPVPKTALVIGQYVTFKSIDGDFANNGLPAKITDYNERKVESHDFPRGIAICVQFPYVLEDDPIRDMEHDFNGRKTWARIDELFAIYPLFEYSSEPSR